jgi:hypothetical protein
MSVGSPRAFALLRVPRGAPRPSETEFRDALTRDRARLHEAPPRVATELTIAGPYPIVVDGAEVDEYTVWEH